MWEDFYPHDVNTMSNSEMSTSMLNAYKEIDASYITIEGLLLNQMKLRLVYVTFLVENNDYSKQ